MKSKREINNRENTLNNRNAALHNRSLPDSVCERIISFVEGRLTVPPGSELAGQPMVILPWQRAFLKRWCADSSDFALSVARGSGKSLLVAAITACIIHPEGPLHRPGSEVTVCSATHSQGSLIVRDVQHFLLSAGCEAGALRIWDNQTHAYVEHKPSGASMLCLGSSPNRLNSRRSRLVLIDELAAFSDAQAEKAIALATTMCGKIEGSRVLVIGTRPESESHPFAQILKNWNSISHTSKSMTMAGARRANPSLDHIPGLRDRVQRELKAARTDVAAATHFKAMRLNQGGSLTGSESVLVSATEWETLVQDDTAVPDNGGYVLGLDLSNSWATTGATAYFPKTGALLGFAAWPELPELPARAKQHGLSASMLHQALADGSLMLFGRHSVDLIAVLLEARKRWGEPSIVAYDPWRSADLKEALYKSRTPPCQHVQVGMGWRDAGLAIGHFKRGVRDGSVHSPSSVMLLIAMADIRVIHDGTGNEKFKKSRRNSVDDLAVSGVMAVSEGLQAWSRVAS